MKDISDIQNLNLSAWILPTHKQRITETPVILTEILLVQLTFLLSTDYQNFSNENITCSKEKNRCLIKSPNMAARLFWDPREQCFGSTMRNDLLTSVSTSYSSNKNGLYGFRRGQTLYDTERTKKPLRFRTSKNFHNCNPYIPKSIEELRRDIQAYDGLNSTISFPIYEITTPFGKPKEQFFGLPYYSNIILDTGLSRKIEKTRNNSGLTKCDHKNKFRSDCCFNIDPISFDLSWGNCSTTICHCTLAHNYGILDLIVSVKSIIETIGKNEECKELKSTFRRFNRIILEEFTFLGIATTQPRLENIAIGLGMSELKDVLETTRNQLTEIIIQEKCKRTSIGSIIYKGIPYITSSITLIIMVYVVLKIIYKRLNKKRERVMEEELANFPLARL